MIEFRKVYIAYKDKPVLEDITLTIRDSEFCVRIGSSGCGKTTLLKSINKLLPLRSGRLSINGTSVQRYSLANLSDLIQQSTQLRLGCTVEFIQREDCLPLLESKYNADFQKVSGLDASLRYDAIQADEVDVVDAFATNALLNKLGLTMLVDVDGMDAKNVAHRFLVEHGLVGE